MTYNKAVNTPILHISVDILNCSLLIISGAKKPKVSKSPKFLITKKSYQ